MGSWGTGSLVSACAKRKSPTTGLKSEIYDDLVAASCEINDSIGKYNSDNNNFNIGGCHKYFELKDVSYAYPSANRRALIDCSLKIKLGELTTIVGSSGAGKSTLLDMISGLIRQDSGTMRLDAQFLNTKDFKIGYAAQQMYIFNGSIKFNITLETDDSKIDPRRLDQILDGLQLNEIISQLEEGINTNIGQFGWMLSGGQRQRIGLARAIYKDFDLLILDEATSALDNKTEELVIEFIKELCRNKLIIMSSHRINPVKMSEMIYVMSNGEIVSSGSYEYLINNSTEFCSVITENKLD